MDDQKKTKDQLITELRTLRRSEELYRRLIDVMRDGYVLTRDGQILFANQAMGELLGCSADELVGRWWKDFIDPEVAEYIDQTPMVDLPPLFDAVVHRLDGGRRIFELAIRSASYQGELAEFTLVRDITERKDTEETLRHWADALEALQATVLDIIAPLNLSTLLQTIVRRAVHLLKSSSGGMYLCDPEQRLVRCVVSHNTARDYTGTVLKYGEGAAGTVAQTGEPLIIEDYRAWSGRAIVFEAEKPFASVLSAPMIWQGQVLGVIHVLDNVESQRFSKTDLDLLTLLANHAAIAVVNARLNEQVQRHASDLEQQVAERTRELAEANERLKDLERLKSKFITDISHELRTPLTNIRLGLHLMASGQPENQSEYLSVVQANSVRLERLVDDILHFSLLELDKVEFTSVDLNAIVEQVVIAYRSRAEAAGLELIFDPSAVLPSVKGQPRQLLRLVSEVLDNAVTYTQDGIVQVSTYPGTDGSQVCLEIQDTGRGIQRDDIPHVFEKFYRGQGVGGSSIPGVGLGLSIAKEIAELHGGKIEVKSQVRKGSTFFVWLPVQ